MYQSPESEIEAARRWLDEMCHHAGVRQTLDRGIEYVEAVERAGLAVRATCGDELYDFLSDPAVATARSRAFVEPTL